MEISNIVQDGKSDDNNYISDLAYDFELAQGVKSKFSESREKEKYRREQELNKREKYEEEAKKKKEEDDEDKEFESIAIIAEMSKKNMIPSRKYGKSKYTS